MAKPNKPCNPYETVVLDREPDQSASKAPGEYAAAPEARSDFGGRLLAFALGGVLVVVLAAGFGLWQLLRAPAERPAVSAARLLPTVTALPTPRAAPTAVVAAALAPTAVAIPAQAAPRATETLALAAAPVATGARAITLGTAGDQWQFDPAKLEIASGETVALTFVNKSKQRHNWVLVRGGDAVAAKINEAGAFADVANDYLPADRADIVASIGLVRGGEATVLFEAPPAGTYTFLCTVPGHYDTGMSGTLVVR